MKKGKEKKKTWLSFSDVIVGFCCFRLCVRSAGIEPRALGTLSTCSTDELHPECSPNMTPATPKACFLSLAFNLDYYTEVLDLSYLLDHLASDPFFRHYRQLNEKLVQLIEDYSLVSFIPLNIQVLSTARPLPLALDCGIHQPIAQKALRA